MDDKDTKTLTFVVSSEEADSIDNAAREAGVSRSEYLRQRVTNPSDVGSGQPSKDTTVLLQHVLYGLHAVHTALHAIAETTGGLSAAQAEKILGGSLKNSRDFLAHLDERITTVRQQIPALEGEPQIKKPAQEIKGDGLSRSV